MARIYLVAAIVLTALSALFSLNTRGKFTAVRAELSAAKQSNQVIVQAKDAADAEAKKAKAQVELAKTEKETAETEAKTAKAEADKVKSEATDAATKLQALTDELKAANEKLAASTPAPEATPDPAIEQKVKEADAKVAEQAQVAAALEAKLKEAEAKAKALEDESIRRAAGLSKPGLEGKILAVNPNWNFVVLNIGDKSGVSMNSTLVIKRGGNMVGKVRVSTVEPGTAIADIVAGSLSKGDYVRPGDSVIFSGSGS